MASSLRQEQIEEVRRMSISERLALAFRLGDDDLELFSIARNLGLREAAAELRRGRRIGRRPSLCFADP